MSTREALIAIGNLVLLILAAACVGGATFYVGSAVVPDLAPLIAVFAVVFFFYSFLGESVLKTCIVFLLATAAAWFGIRYIPVFEVSYSVGWQVAGDVIGFLIGISTGKPLAYLYQKIEDR